MAWMQCRSCSTKFAVGLLRCPQCQMISELYAAPEEAIEAEKESAMPKITVAAGPSNALDDTGEPEAAPAAEEKPVAGPEPTETANADAAPDDEATATEPAAAETQAPAAPAPKKRAAAKKTAAAPQA